MNHRQYMAEIGARGGRKSRRKLSHKDAVKMAKRRWRTATEARTHNLKETGK